MASSVPKLRLSSSRDIPFDKLVLSQSNVRRVKCGVSIGELAEDIVRRTLLQSLNVRPVLDADGQDTGKFEVPAGGLRSVRSNFWSRPSGWRKPSQCLAWCAKVAAPRRIRWRKCHARGAASARPVPRLHGAARAGEGEEEIAAAFCVTPGIVKQRCGCVRRQSPARDLCGGRDHARPADGILRLVGSCPPGPGVRRDRDLLERPAAHNPAHADRKDRPR